jgi:PhnB protein
MMLWRWHYPACADSRPVLLMQMITKPIPDGYDSLIPYLVVRNAAKAIDFYKELFGATEKERMTYPDSPRIMHAEIKIRDHVLMLSDENPECGALSPLSFNGSPPASVFLYVKDADAVFEKAVKLGAKGVMSPEDMFWGDRYGRFVDPFGHHWSVATHKRDVSHADMIAGAAEMFQHRKAA